MLRLTELEPEWMRHRWVAVPPDKWVDGRMCPDGIARYVDHVNISTAHCVWFLCPKCFVQNRGSRGTHWIEVGIAGRDQQADECSHDSSGQPSRWGMSGADFNDLTFTPSILLIGGCGWHGFITNGLVTGDGVEQWEASMRRVEQEEGAQQSSGGTQQEKTPRGPDEESNKPAQGGTSDGEHGQGGGDAPIAPPPNQPAADQGDAEATRSNGGLANFDANNTNLSDVEVLVDESPAPAVMTVTQDGTEVLKICADGRVIWRGREVETDTDFRLAMMDMAENMRKAANPPVMVDAEPVSPLAGKRSGDLLDAVRVELSKFENLLSLERREEAVDVYRALSSMVYELGNFVRRT